MRAFSTSRHRRCAPNPATRSPLASVVRTGGGTRSRLSSIASKSCVVAGQRRRSGRDWGIDDAGQITAIHAFLQYRIQGDAQLPFGAGWRGCNAMRRRFAGPLRSSTSTRSQARRGNASAKVEREAPCAGVRRGARHDGCCRHPRARTSRMRVSPCTNPPSTARDATGDCAPWRRALRAGRLFVDDVFRQTFANDATFFFQQHCAPAGAARALRSWPTNSRVVPRARICSMRSSPWPGTAHRPRRAPRRRSTHPAPHAPAGKPQHHARAVGAHRFVDVIANFGEGNDVVDQRIHALSREAEDCPH